MRLAISIEHPAWAHQFQRIINENNKTGETLVLAVDKDGDLQLLDSYGITYLKLADSTGRNIIEKGWLFVRLCISYTKAIREFQPDLLIGRASPMMAVAARITGKPHIIFEDTEVSRFSLNLCKRYSSCIITPMAFHTDLGDKQARLPIYKELFYLHDREFTPDPTVVSNAGIDVDKPFIVVRFIAWQASHDVGMSEISANEKIEFIKKLSTICKVYISSESNIPAEIASHRLKIPYDKIHHILYYASIVISEGASTASEAAVLGTHALYLSDISYGTTEEQEDHFHILKAFHDKKTRYESAYIEAKEMLKDKDLWKKGKEKRKKILEEMPDPNDLFIKKMEEMIN